MILATGVIDNMPEIDGLKDHIDAGRIRLCPVCDGFEVSDQPVAIYGTADHVLQKALFLRGFTENLTLLCTDSSHARTTSRRSCSAPRHRAVRPNASSAWSGTARRSARG